MLFLKNIFLTCFLLLFFTINSKSQDNYTINGIVKDSLSGETLIGVTLKFNGKAQVGTSTNAYGFFSYKLSSGDYDLSVSYVGYKTISTRSLERRMILLILMFLAMFATIRMRRDMPIGSSFGIGSRIQQRVQRILTGLVQIIHPHQQIL